MAKIRRAAGTQLDPFPGEAAWRRQVELRIEWDVSILRAVAIVLTTGAWVVLPRGPGSHPALVWLTVTIAWLYGGVTAITALRRRDLLESIPLALAPVFDMAILFLWLFATGGRESPFLPLLFLGAVSAPLRLPPVPAVGASVIYAAAYALLGGRLGFLYGAYVLLVGLGSTRWGHSTYIQRRHALRDPLTGCLGRDYARFQIEQLLARRQTPFTIGLIDLDGFKQVNDQYGHRAGDEALTKAVHLMNGMMRPGDLLSRLGGDEFLVVWPETTLQQAQQIAERMRTTFEQTALRMRSTPELVALTLSIGVAVADDYCSVDRLIHTADEALYKAKSSRNCVVCTEEVAC